jgi:hypothetical protein
MDDSECPKCKRKAVTVKYRERRRLKPPLSYRATPNSSMIKKLFRAILRRRRTCFQSIIPETKLYLFPKPRRSIYRRVGWSNKSSAELARFGPG